MKKYDFEKKTLSEKFRRFINKRSVSERVVYALVFIIFCAFAFSYLYMIFWCFISGMRTNDAVSSNAFGFNNFQPRNYIDVFSMLKVNDNNFLQMFLNSMYFCFLGPLLNIMVTAMMSYVTAKYKFFGSKAVYFVVLVVITLPLYGTGTAMYKLLYKLKFLNSRMMIFTSLNGFSIYYMYFFAFWQGVSKSYAEAAEIDGANKWQIYFKIMLPVTLLAALTMSVSAFVACGDGGNKGDKGNQGNPNEVQIYYWNSGYKLEFMKKIVADFNASQTTYKAILDSDQSASTIIKSLDLNESNPYDLYFTMLNTNQYNKQFIKLDDVLDSKADGENVTIREKYYDYLLNGVKNTDGTTNFLTYGNGWCSIVYDADVIDGVKYKVPNTTDELETLVAELEGDDKTAWLFYNDVNNNGYLNYALFGWEAQYDGIDYYNNNMLALKDANGNTPSKDVFLAKDGRYEALKVFEKVITPYNSHKGCTSTNFTTVQTLYLKGEAVLTVNGSWLMNESTGTKDNFVMMKLPVISSIVNKLEDKSMSDATLSRIVAEIDEGKQSSELCSAGDFARIKEARNVMYNNAAEQYVFIPEYSNAIDGAKAFLKYFYSDKGTKTFMETVKLPSAVKLADESSFDDSKLSAWDKAQFNFSKNLTAVTNTMTKSPVFTNASTTQIANLFYCQALIASNPNDYKGADLLWDQLTATINKNWNDWSKNA